MAMSSVVLPGERVRDGLHGGERAAAAAFGEGRVGPNGHGTDDQGRRENVATGTEVGVENGQTQPPLSI